ncbi:hypothetical protein LXL04_011305 [Taraxacum kok-saghyz]
MNFSVPLKHLSKKICDFDEERLKTKAGLRSFLGILNYARNYIPMLSLLLGHLYEKTNPHGDKIMKPSYYDRNIKQKVQALPDLQIPPEEAYIIIETDGCMEGWGGICKWKKKKEDPRKDEKICANASGKFKVVQSTIDAEINACINSLEKLKIYYLDKKEITLRTDCQTIVSFYNKTNSNKASRVRWLKFADIITGTGLQIHIEHIDGKQNVLADSLSRLVNICFAGCTEQVQAKEVIMKSLQITEELTRHCVVKEREEWLQANNPDFRPMPQVYNDMFTFQQPGALYRHYQIKANTTPISLAESSAYAGIAQQLERTAATEAVAALRHLHAILDFKAQVCISKSTRDNHWGDHRPEVKRQNKDARRILLELEKLCNDVGRVQI